MDDTQHALSWVGLASFLEKQKNKKKKQKQKQNKAKKPLKAISRQHTLYFIGSWIAITTNGRHLTCVDLGWVAKTVKNFDWRANLISTIVSTAHRKSTQVQSRPGQTE